jgi:hypothetical protein
MWNLSFEESQLRGIAACHEIRSDFVGATDRRSAHYKLAKYDNDEAQLFFVCLDAHI